MKKAQHTLTMVAGELNMSAKTLRAILRKNDYSRPGTRWEFSTEEKNDIKAMVKSRKTRAAKAAPVEKKARRSRKSDDGAQHVHH